MKIEYLNDVNQNEQQLILDRMNSKNPKLATDRAAEKIISMSPGDKKGKGKGKKGAKKPIQRKRKQKYINLKKI